MTDNAARNKIWQLRILLMIFIGLAFVFTSLHAQSKMWVSAYYAGWMQGQNNDGYLPAQDIDYSAVTQIIHFALVPNSDGTLDYSSNSITPANSAALVADAHAAGVKALICVGGWNSESAFMGATSPTNLTTFVSNLINFIKSRGYDGIDIDWEPISSGDLVQYTAFITALRTALNLISPRPLLTAATQWQPAIFSTLAGDFDEINLMTYDFSGAWQGWVTWHNSPVYNGGVKFPSTGGYVPSANDMASSFSTAGIPKNKLGIGIDFYGYVWSGGTGTPTGGVTAPDQSWTTAPTVQANVPYYTIMQQYYQPGNNHWDSGAQAAYISIDNTGSANDKFISYDDTTTCRAKVNYVKNNGLGGVIIWELGAGYQSTNPAGQRQLMLEAVKNAVNGSSGGQTPDTTPPTITLSSPSNGSTVSGTISLSANASDNVGVKNVIFKVDGSQTGSALTASPYSVSFNTTSIANGSHTITATASDAAGNTASATATVTVSNTVSDNIPPVVSITSPVNGSTVSGNITLSANATDNVGVKNVTFKIDGSQLGNVLTASPYNVAFNTSTVTNGSHTFTATASDAAGNSTSATSTFTVSNTVATGGGSTSSSDLYVYLNNLESNWTNTSWNVTTNFTSSKIVCAGSSNSLNVIQNAWGALRFLSGSWSSIININPADFNSVQFAVYGESNNLNLSVNLGDNSKGVFPTINYGFVPANQWVVVSIPLSTLDPNNLAFNEMTIQDVNGTTVTFDLDNIKFTGKASAIAAAPVLNAPANNQTGLTSSTTLSWSSSAGAVSYNVEVATDQAFTNIYTNKTSDTTTSFAISNLTSGNTYYWKVASVDSGGTDTWSSVWNFTVGGTSSTTASLAVYNDALVSPWINASWNATVDFASSDYAYQGSKSIKVVQNAWGGLSLHDGSWSSGNSVDASLYNAIQFAVYSTSGVSLSVALENDGGSSFPKINYGSVPSNQWTLVTIPLNKLNPNNNSIQRLDILETSGAQKTYYIDNLSFVSTPSANQLAKTDNNKNVPDKFGLEQNYPNPFNPSTTIDFSIAVPEHVSLDIYNILGQKVATLVNDYLPEGEHSVVFNADNLASGIYIYMLRAGNKVMEKKMTLLK